MKRRDLLKSASVYLLSAVACTPSRLPASDQRPLIMGIFPRRNIKTTYQLFTPLAQYLSEMLQREVRLKTTRDFESFWQGIINNEYDIVHFNQYHYIVSNIHYGYRVIARNQEFGHSTLTGSIMVRKDSGINEIADLKGKTILFGGGPRAMQSYIAATWLLRQGGLDAGDYTEKFAVNPPNAIISTYHRLADAAGSGDVVIRLDTVMRAIDVSSMKYLARTQPLAHLPWAVRGDLDPELIDAIQQALISLNDSLDGQTVLDSAKLSAIEPAQDSDYDECRRIIRDVYGDDFGFQALK
jgi:phosphonate transport system substrate-binding protein